MGMHLAWKGGFDTDITQDLIAESPTVTIFGGNIVRITPGSLGFVCSEVFR